MSRHSNARRDVAPPAKAALKIVMDGSEWALADARITIGRAKDAVIQINDGLVSGKHALISNGIVSDQGSTNGTFLNGKQLKPSDKTPLKAGDKVTCGDAVLMVERGEVKVSVQEKLRSSQRFPDKNSSKAESKEEVKKVETAEDKMTVEELMEEEFKKIIGHEKIKAQLRQFHKKVQLDNIRLQNGKIKEKPRLYHMIFSGPPGTGKTTMANVVSKIMLKMKLVSTDKVVFVNNPLELLGGYVGQTAPKVDAKVEEAKGGILFIDEAYSIVKGGSSKENHSFGREAIDTIMKHLDPPTAVFIFAGYEAPMEEFLKVNEGLARRIPYRYGFEAYNLEQLQAIFEVMCDSKGEHIDSEIIAAVATMLSSLPANLLPTQNAGLINNWVSFAQIERDDRVDIDEVLANPDLASILALSDFEKALDKVKQMV